MTQYEDSRYGEAAGQQAGEAAGTQTRATGIVLLAAVLMIVAGTFHFLQGIAALLDGTFFAAADNYAFDLNVEVWGWLHVLAGIGVFLIGIALLSGTIWARILAAFIVLISAVLNFVYIPFHPLWAIVLLALDGVILWALLTQGDWYTPSSPEDVLGGKLW